MAVRAEPFWSLVGDIHLGGEIDNAFTFYPPFSCFPLGPNPQGALTLSRQRSASFRSPKLDGTETAFAPV